MTWLVDNKCLDGLLRDFTKLAVKFKCDDAFFIRIAKLSG